MKLKACPFCGSTNLKKHFQTVKQLRVTWVHCDECPAGVYSLEGIEDALEKWNALVIK